MNRSWRTTLASAAALAASFGAAEAADLFNGGGMKDYGSRPVLSYPSTWYLRLDGAYATHDTPRMVSNGIDDLAKTGINDTWSIGGGVGRYINQSFRTDFTVDYRFDTDVHGRNLAPGATFPGTSRFGMESTVLLANVYYDLNRGTWFNPYVGLGLGTAYNQTNAGHTHLGGDISGSSEWHVAGAAMAGFTVALVDRVNLDLGYRFLYLGETKAGGTRDGFGNVEGGPTVEDIHAHEFRFGVRYDLR